MFASLIALAISFSLAPVSVLICSVDFGEPSSLNSEYAPIPPIVITPEYGLAAFNTLPPPVVAGTNTLCAAAYILGLVGPPGVNGCTPYVVCVLNLTGETLPPFRIVTGKQPVVVKN